MEGDMRLRGVHHVEINVVDYENSIKFYDRMFGWLGYSSFSTLGIEYEGTYYHAFPHSYVGIQPAKSNDPLDFDEWRPGINHIALHAKNRKEVNKFYEQFLLKDKVTILYPPQEYLYTPNYYAVFFIDSSGIKWELAHFPFVPTPWAIYKWWKLLGAERQKHPEWKRHPFFESLRKLPKPREGK
jgi:catechol 2,3-dioxygenase-like lactoylglutathione lyase family enzyme